MDSNIRYFDFGFEDTQRPMRVVMYGIGAYASGSGQTLTRHTNSTFIYLRNRVRHSLFRQIFIVGVGRGIHHEKTLSGARGLEDVYFEHISIEFPHSRGIEVNGDYNVRFTDVYGGWTATDTYIIQVNDVFALWITRPWILYSSPRAIRLINVSKAYIRDVVIESCSGSNAIEIINSDMVRVDGIHIDTVGNYSPAYIFTLRNNQNLYISNVYAKYVNNILYLAFNSIERIL